LQAALAIADHVSDALVAPTKPHNPANQSVVVELGHGWPKNSERQLPNVGFLRGILGWHDLPQRRSY
jgi:hypothetical protein